MGQAPRRRRRWLWLGVLPALLLLGVLGLRALLQPERLSAFLLEQASQATGLQLELSQPAGIGLWPDLHLELNGLVARTPGAVAPLLRARNVEAVLPWSALHSGALQIRSLRVVAPQLDWAALQGWLATRESPDAPFSLPRIDADLEVREGRVTGQGWALDAVALHLPALRTGEKTTLRLGFMFVRTPPATGGGAVKPAKTVRGEPVEPAAVPSGPAEPAAVRPQSGQLASTVRSKPVEPHSVRYGPYELLLSATPRADAQGLRIDDLAIVLDGLADAPIPITGTVSWTRDAGFATSLIGELERWPAPWPALPLPPADAPATIALTYDAPRISLALDRADDGLEADFALGDLGAWMNDPAAPPLPPLAGSARAERLQTGGIELRGVELRIEDDDAEP
jgi:hypothetical protein